MPVSTQRGSLVPGIDFGNVNNAMPPLKVCCIESVVLFGFTPSGTSHHDVCSPQAL
jgi:hypothetical protein